MFSNRIANSARFLQMPIESQLLYFHMILRADDDGVVESYPVMKLLGVTPDNFKILIAKKFIEQLNEDQVVIIINWLEHNKIRADRKKDSIYKHLIPKEMPLLEPKPRSDVKDNSNRIGGQSMDSVSKVSIGKVRLGKVSIVKDMTKPTPLQISKDFFDKKESFNYLFELFAKQVDRKILKVRFEEFVLYWTEPNKSGTKVKWEQQSTFDVKRRLYTWLKNSHKFDSGTNNSKYQANEV